MKDRLNKVVTDIDLYSLEVYKPGFLKSDDVNSRYRYFRLHYNEEPIDVSGLTAKAYMLKSDGKEVWNHLTIEDGLVVLEFTQQALASPGQLGVEIVLSDSNMTFELSSFILQFEVIRSLRTDASIESTNEFGVLQAFLRDLSGANEKYNTWNAKLEALYNDYTASHEAFKQTDATIVASEGARVVSEDARKAEEAIRVSNENQRKADELTRVNTENARKQAEVKRQEAEITIQANETQRQTQEATRQQQESARASEFEKMQQSFNSLAPEQSTNAEVQLARRDVAGKEHASLKERLDADAKMRDVVTETKEGTVISFTGTVPSPITNVIVKGNTYQNPNNLAEIASSGIDNGDGTWTYKIASCGVNLAHDVQFPVGTEYATCCRAKAKLLPNTTYTLSLVVPQGEVFVTETTVFTRRIALTGNNSRQSVTVTTKDVIKPQAQGHFPLFFNEGGKQSAGNAKDLQIQVGSVATAYEPYKEEVASIKLPCQLEKVFAISDVLYFDEVENAWCVSKNTTKRIFTGKDVNGWNNEDSKKFMELTCNDILSNKPLFSDRYAFTEAVYSNVGIGYVGHNAFRVKPSNYLSITTKEQAIAEMDKNPLLVYYPLKTPQKIVLPQSEQIKLNAFAESATVYTMSGAFDAIVQATVSKTHSSATMENTKEIEKLSNQLQSVIDNKDDVEYTHKSENGVVLAKDTNRGNISKVLISGSTLNNLYNATSVGVVSTNLYLYQNANSRTLTLNKTVTLYNTAKKKIIVDIYDLNTTKWIRSIVINSRTKQVEKLNANEYIHVIYGQSKDGWLDNETDKNMLFNTGIVIEGECAHESLEYFKGLSSVANESGLSLVTQNSNLWDGTTLKAHLEGGTNIFRTDTTGTLSTIVKIHQAGRYYGSCVGGNRDSIAYFRTMPVAGDSPVIAGNGYIDAPASGYLVFYMTNQSNVQMPSDIYVGTRDTYSAPQVDTQPIMYRDDTGEWVPVTELQGISLACRDTIEEHADGRLYYHIRTGKKVFDGSEPNLFEKQAISDTKVNRFNARITDMALTKCELLCDKYKVNNFHVTDEENIGHNTQGLIALFINKSKANTVEELNKLLQEDPITLLYQLNNEVVYPCNAIEADIFEGDTSITTNARNVQPDLDITITSSINSLIGNIDDTLDHAVDDIQELKHDVAKLTSSKEYEFSGEGYKVMNETEQGTLSDLTIYGKSYNNLGGKVNCTVTEYQALLQRDISLFKPNQVYTFAITNTQNHAVKLYANEYQFIGGGTYRLIEPQTTLVFECTAKSTLIPTDNVILKSGNPQSTIYRLDVVILEGSVPNPPQYFEGIASVGNGNEIEVASHNANLISPNFGKNWYTLSNNLGASNVTMNGYDISISNDMSAVGDYYVISKDVFNLPKNTECVLSFEASYTSTYEGNTVYLLSMNDPSDYTKGYRVVANVVNQAGVIRKQFNSRDYENIVLRFNNNKPGNVFTVKKLQVTLAENTEYTQPYEDKKPVLFKDTDGTWKHVTELHGLNVSKFDTIESHADNKLYYHKRLAKYVFTGNERVETFGTTGTNDTIAFLINNIVDSINNDVNIPDGNFINNRLPYKDVYSNRDNIAGINVHLKGVRIAVMKSELETQDVAGMTKLLKKWHTEGNPLQIIYLLREEEVYEVSPILPQVFDNATMLQILGGPISAEFKAKCIASYSRRIESIESRLDRVEENVFKVVDNIQATIAQADMANFAYAVNVASVQDAQDRMLMESDMRLMQVELMLSAEPASTKTITYTSVNAKGGAVVMTSTYYEFISHMIERGTHDKAFIAKYIDMCEQTGRLTKEEAEQLRTELNPPAIEHA